MPSDRVRKRAVLAPTPRSSDLPGPGWIRCRHRGWLRGLWRGRRTVCPLKGGALSYFESGKSSDVMARIYSEVRSGAAVLEARAALFRTFARL